MRSLVSIIIFSIVAVTLSASLPSPFLSSKTHSITSESKFRSANPTAADASKVSEPVDNSLVTHVSNKEKYDFDGNATVGLIDVDDQDGDENNSENEYSDEATDEGEYGTSLGSNETSSQRRMMNSNDPNATIIEDYFGNVVKVSKHKTTLQPSKPRDLMLSSILLGPFVGVTVKAALLRGLFWAVLAYILHLFVPSLTSSLGLGTGLVGFARQFNPGYMQMIMPQISKLPAVLINSVPQSTRQQLANYSTTYSPYLNPVVQTISSIPDQNCRYRAICEAASYFVVNSPFMSTSLQRLSATAYVNIGTDYSKAWLDGVVQSDCAVKYSSCAQSPFRTMATRLADSLRAHQNAAHNSVNVSKVAADIADIPKIRG